MTKPSEMAKQTDAEPSSGLPLWAVIAAGGVITALSLGVRSTFGLFLDPVVESLETDRGTFALAIAIQQIVWGISQPIAGAISDRYGAGRTLAAGSLMYAVALLLMSTASSPGMLLLSAGFLVGLAIGAASFAVVLSAVGRMVPPERRTMSLGIVSAIGSLGQFILVPVAGMSIDNTSWETTAVILAFVALAAILLTPAVRGRASDYTEAASGDSEDGRPLRQELRRAAHARPYLLLNGAFFVCGFHVTFIATHLPAFSEDLGQPGSAAATALALVGLFNVFGSLAAGWLGARHSNTKLLAGIYGLRAVVITAFMLVPASSTATIVFGAAIGVLWLSTVPLTSAMVTEQFGTAHSGTLFGIVFLSHQIGAFAGAWIGGELADATGSYDSSWWIAVGLGLLAMALQLLIKEGPVPEPPPVDPRGIRLAPTGVAVALVAIGVVSVFSALDTAEARA
ncbi:MAG: MFS transporter, partial [Acidimicrobiales bacterium]